MLDGFVVNVGDSIYDLLLDNLGIVTAVDGGSLFTVGFGIAGSLTYASGGTIAGRRRAYWRNPILTIPQKNDSEWQLLQNVVNAIRSS